MTGTSTKRLFDRGHRGKDRWRSSVLAAVAAGVLLALPPGVAMGQADEEYLPPPDNPGNNDGPSGAPGGGPTSPGGSPGGAGAGTGSPGGGGSGSGGVPSGGSGDVSEQAASSVPSEDPAALSGASADEGGSSGQGERSGGRDRDPAKKLPGLEPLNDSLKPKVAFGVQGPAAGSDISTIAILAGIILAVTLAAVLLRRRLHGAGGS